MRAAVDEQTSVGILLKFDFTQRVFTINFFTVFDIMAVLGGFKSSLGPLLTIFTPMLTLMFLFQLSTIIRERMVHTLEDEVSTLMDLADEATQKIRHSITCEDLHFEASVHVILDKLTSFVG